MNEPFHYAYQHQVRRPILKTPPLKWIIRGTAASYFLLACAAWGVLWTCLGRQPLGGQILVTINIAVAWVLASADLLRLLPDYKKWLPEGKVCCSLVGFFFHLILLGCQLGWQAAVFDILRTILNIAYALAKSISTICLCLLAARRRKH